MIWVNIKDGSVAQSSVCFYESINLPVRLALSREMSMSSAKVSILEWRSTTFEKQYNFLSFNLRICLLALGNSNKLSPYDKIIWKISHYSPKCLTVEYLFLDL